MEYYLIAINGLYKDEIKQISAFGAPKNKDTGEEIKPVDIYYLPIHDVRI